MHTFDESEEQMIKVRLFTSRIIVLAILTGELIFCAIALYMRLSGKFSSTVGTASLWPIVVGVFCAMALGALTAVRIMQWKTLIPEQPLETFLQRFFTFAVVIPQAICEAPAFFCLVTVLIGAKLAIMLPIFAAIILIQLSMFPTRARFENIYNQAQERRALQQARIE